VDRQNLTPARVWALVHEQKLPMKTVTSRLGIQKMQAYDLLEQERSRRELAALHGETREPNVRPSRSLVRSKVRHRPTANGDGAEESSRST
jgi:hypothetical protein